MRKSGFIILGLTAFLTLGTSRTALAAGGWSMENGKWMYYDNSGYIVTDEWQRGADNLWRYLNGHGEMAVNSWVDDTYYVDANGIMVSGKWMKLNYSFNGDTSEEHWYYFLDNGKVVKDTWKKIDNKWYHFDLEGAMETGWMDNDMSYSGDDGAAYIGWHKLYPPEGQERRDDPYDDDGKYWYYFTSTGKKFVPELSNGADYGEKRIDGTYYCFDRSGAMQTGWVYVGEGEADDSSIKDYRFYNSSGKGVTGWYSAEPPVTVRGYENEVEWFYFSKSGVPKYGPEEGTASTKDFVRIGDKTYLFNQRGTPVTGLQKVYVNGSDYSAYYFDPISCTVQTGKMTVDEGDGNKTQYYFSTGGKGYTGVQSGILYYKGKIQKAESGSKYEVISIPASSGKYTNYLINNSGKMIKSTSGVKDNGVKYITNSSGVVTKIGEEVIDSSSMFREPEEPAWD